MMEEAGRHVVDLWYGDEQRKQLLKFQKHAKSEIKQ